MTTNYSNNSYDQKRLIYKYLNGDSPSKSGTNESIRVISKRIQTISSF
jgi:hypothetical protein